MINQRLRDLRLTLKLSQEAIGAQGFVSTSGWIKIENGRRQPGDGLLEKFVVWLQRDRYVSKRDAELLLNELLSLKYMSHASPFIRRLARDHHASMAETAPLLKVAEDPVRYRASSKS